MPQSYKLSAQAKFELAAILSYIGQERPIVARSIAQKFREAFELLSENPNIGHMRSHITNKNLRFWQVYHYSIIYEVQQHTVYVVHIISNQRDIEQLL